MIIYSYLYFFVLLLIIYIYKYVLVLLIIAEIVVIVVAFIILLIFRNLGLDFLIIFYLVFRVCESVLGLGVLVVMVRFSGNDLYYIFNISKF